MYGELGEESCLLIAVQLRQRDKVGVEYIGHDFWIACVV